MKCAPNDKGCDEKLESQKVRKSESQKVGMMSETKTRLTKFWSTQR